MAYNFTFIGLIRMASRYMLVGLKEISQSAFPGLQLKQLQKFIPDITRADISRGPAGVRAQGI